MGKKTTLSKILKENKLDKEFLGFNNTDREIGTGKKLFGSL